MEQNILLSAETAFPFQNHADDCVGTGHIALALQQEYLDQLALVQREIGFRYIRGHGLFDDDMAILQKETTADGTTHTWYNFTLLDRVMDAYRRLNIRPFLELSFMPEKLASGKQTVFYYKGNVTPPQDMAEWCALVTATLRHLIARYGAEEVLAWPIEVWNEPNLAIFWENADQDAYFCLFAATFRAIKTIDARFQVGGPAVCDIGCNAWVEAFCRFCAAEDLHPDFISRHHYTAEAPAYDGHYGYVKLHEPGWAQKEIHSTRTLLEEIPGFETMPLYLTEFNTSYIPRCPLHDTCRNAAHLAGMLAWLGEECASYSYWTFGDVFEEEGIPRTPFHGGFGLVADGCIPKPTFWIFAFYKRLQGECLYRGRNALVIKTPENTYRGIAWNDAETPETQELALKLTFPETAGRWCFTGETVDETHANPRKLWHDWGEPASLTERQKDLLRRAAQPFIESRTIKADGTLTAALTVEKNGVLYFELAPAPLTPDAGFCYERQE